METSQAVRSTSAGRVFANLRLAPKMLVAFLAVVIIPLAVYSAISIPQTRNALLAQGETSLSTHNTNTANAIDQYLISRREDIVADSMLPSLQNLIANPRDSQTQATALKELKSLANKKYYESLAVVNTEGTIILSTSDADINTSIQFRPYFLEAMKGNAGYVSDPSVSVITGQPAIFFSSPILDSGGNIRGVVRSRLSLLGIWDLVEQDKDAVGSGTHGILVDENGIRIATSQSLGNREAVANTLLYTAIMPVPAEIEKTLVAEKRFGNATATNVRVLPLPDVANALVTPGIKAFETTADNSPERHYATVSALSIKPWRYVLMTPLSTFTSAADNLRTVSILITIIVAALTIIFAIFLSRGITRPIIQLTKVADRISLGELDAKIEIDRKDEIGELAEAVSRMQASLQAAIERLRARRSGS